MPESFAGAMLEFDWFSFFRKLGEGAFGIVLAAVVQRLVHNRIQRAKCALKISVSVDWEDLIVIQREVTYGSLLKHPNLMPVLGFGYVPLFEPKAPWRICTYLVMEQCKCTAREYLRGRIKGQRKQARPLLYCGVINDALQGLRHMHEHNVAHRDLKEDNILIKRTPEGKLKCMLSDLGGARDFFNPTKHDGRTVTIFGTPGYMAPEMFAMNKKTMRYERGLPADVWSINCIVFRQQKGGGLPGISRSHLKKPKQYLVCLKTSKKAATLSVILF